MKNAKNPLIRKYHEGIKNEVKCEKCEKLFSDKTTLKQHMIVHNQIKERKKNEFKYDNCDKAYGDNK